MELSLRRIEDRPLDLWRGGGFFSDIEGGTGCLFDEVFGDSCVTYVVPETRGVYSPRIDINETADSINVSAEMPGMNRNDIDVSVHDGILTISGEKKVQDGEKVVNYHHAERSYGCFTRDISLPDTVNINKVEAAYKNGVLSITVPKTQEAIAESRKIPVSTA
jgi:HSP20 family protein